MLQVAYLAPLLILHPKGAQGQALPHMSLPLQTARKNTLCPVRTRWVWWPIQQSNNPTKLHWWCRSIGMPSQLQHIVFRWLSVVVRRTSLDSVCLCGACTHQDSCPVHQWTPGLGTSTKLSAENKSTQNTERYESQQTNSFQSWLRGSHAYLQLLPSTQDDWYIN